MNRERVKSTVEADFAFWPVVHVLEAIIPILLQVGRFVASLRLGPINLRYFEEYKETRNDYFHYISRNNFLMITWFECLMGTE